MWYIPVANLPLPTYGHLSRDKPISMNCSLYYSREDLDVADVAFHSLPDQKGGEESG